MTLGKCLVSGGAGFVGSHLVGRLLDAGFEVVVFDDLSTGRLVNLLPYEGRSLVFIKGDVCVPPPEITNEKYTQVWHLACPASPPQYQKDMIKTIRTGVLGTEQMLNIALASDCPLLYTSTSEVYGDPETHPQKESYLGAVQCRGPRSCYDESKRCGEALCWSFMRQRRGDRKGFRVSTARIFNTYGPNMDPHDGRVVSNFIVQILQGRPLTVYGKGQQTRSFGYVDDTVEGLMRLMASGQEGPVNIGNPHEFTILELAKVIGELIGVEPKLVFLPSPPDDPRIRQPDITLARTLLGWEPKVDLREGLEKTIGYFRAHLMEFGSISRLGPAT